MRIKCDICGEKAEHKYKVGNEMLYICERCKEFLITEHKDQNYNLDAIYENIPKQKVKKSFVPTGKRYY